MNLKKFAGPARAAAIQTQCALLLLGIALGARGDQVEMTNGDRYVGRVLTLGSDTLLLQSEVLGTLRLPRGRISTITLEPGAAGPGTNPARLAPGQLRSNSVSRVSSATSTNATAQFSAAMRQLSSNSNVIHQVQDQLLTGAGPEAQTKFNDLVGGLMSGKIDLGELRAQAKSTLDQAKRTRSDMGEEGGAMLDSYLAILDSFLKETDPGAGPTNAPTGSAGAFSPKQEEQQ
jgi:hypothetical protein